MFSRSGKNLTILFILCCFAIFTNAAFGQDAESGKELPAKCTNEIANPSPEILNKKIDGEVVPDEPININPDFQESQNSVTYVSENENSRNTDPKVTENQGFDARSRPTEFPGHFLAIGGQRNSFYDNDLKIPDRLRSFGFPATEPADKAKKTDSADDGDAAKAEKFDWRSAINQSLIFLGVQHGYALTQPKTRRALKGKFFKDYVDSVKALNGWDDGGRFFTNYIAHPMQGAFTGFIYVQNDPKARKQQFGATGDYWKSRLKAMAWTAAWSTQFEIGPISQASIGNVGLSGKQTWEDIVVTPTLGTAMLVAEDAADRFIVKAIERHTNNFYIRIFSRMLLSPTRNFSNMLRFKAPWYRDRPYAF